MSDGKSFYIFPMFRDLTATFTVSNINKNNMKTLMIVFLTMGLATASMGQNIPKSEVPSIVLNAFQAKFSNATEVEWELKGDEYKAEFEIGKRNHDVWIDKTGAIKKHKEDFPKKDLPAAITQKLEKEFQTYRIDDADKIELDGKVFYQVELENGTDERKLLLTADGKLESNTID